MNNRQCNKPRQLITKLVRDHYLDVMVYDRGNRRLVPGYVINNLTEEQREILCQLTAEDITDIRWPPV